MTTGPEQFQRGSYEIRTTPTLIDIQNPDGSPQLSSRNYIESSVRRLVTASPQTLATIQSAVRGPKSRNSTGSRAT